MDYYLMPEELLLEKGAETMIHLSPLRLHKLHKDSKRIVPDIYPQNIHSLQSIPYFGGIYSIVTKLHQCL
jgi:hypothetical protein